MNARGATAGLVAGVLALGVAFGVSSTSGPGTFSKIAVTPPVYGDGRTPGTALKVTLIVSPGLFGDGFDGDATISVDTSLSRSTYYHDLTIAAGKYLNTNGYPLHVSGTLTFGSTSSKIGRDGNAAAAGDFFCTVGAALANGSLPGSRRGGAGSVFGGTCEQGNSMNPAPSICATTAAAGGGPATVGGYCQGGGGGNGTGRAGCSALASTFVATHGDTADIFEGINGYTVDGVIWGLPGGGGGGGSSWVSAGCGGGGAGYVVVGVRTIAGAVGVFTAVGGAGFHGDSDGTHVGGGGAGGSGGFLTLVTASPQTTYSVNVSGGAGGGTGGVGGANGAAGGPGVAQVYQVVQ